eukprot:g14227.t1
MVTKAMASVTTASVSTYNCRAGYIQSPKAMASVTMASVSTYNCRAGCVQSPKSMAAVTVASVNARFNINRVGDPAMSARAGSRAKKSQSSVRFALDEEEEEEVLDRGDGLLNEQISIDRGELYFPLCQHKHPSCIISAAQTFWRNLSMAFGLRLGVAIAIRALKLLFQYYRQRTYRLPTMEELLGERNLTIRVEAFRVGLMAGCFTGGTELLRCWLQRWRRRQDGWNSALAGALAGLSLLWQAPDSRRTIALYAFTRLAQCLWNEGKRRRVVTPVPHGETLLFAWGTAQVMYAYVMRPETLPASYWQFIVRAGPIDRCVLDAVRNSNRGQPIDVASIDKYVQRVGSAHGLNWPTWTEITDRRSCLMSHVLCLMSHVSCLMSHHRTVQYRTYMVYGIWYLVYGIWYMVYGTWYMVHGLWSMVSGLWSMIVPCTMVHGIWYMVYGIWYMLYAICYMLYAICYMLNAICHIAAALSCICSCDLLVMCWLLWSLSYVLPVVARPALLPCFVLHPHTARCTKAAYLAFLGAFQQSWTLYASLTFVPMVLFKFFSLIRSPLKYVLRGLLNSTRSACFLGALCGTYNAFVCAFRKVATQDHRMEYWLAGLVSGLALLIEQKQRRPELALYVAPRAFDSLYLQAVDRRFMPTLPHYELWLFCSATAGLMYFFHDHPYATMSPFLHTAFQVMFKSAGRAKPEQSDHDKDKEPAGPHPAARKSRSALAVATRSDQPRIAGPAPSSLPEPGSTSVDAARVAAN